MFFTTIGFIFMVALLSCATLFFALVGLFGGPGLFSPLPKKDYMWYIPVMSMIFYAWYLLFKNCPFTISIT